MATRKRLKVIFDTNWYISASINANSRRKFYNLLKNDKIEVIYSQELMSEYQEVMKRKFSKKITKKQVLRFISWIIPILVEVIIKTWVRVSRDKKDNFLLSMSIDSNADYLVTGDDDLLVLKQIGNTKIVNMTEFLKVLDFF